MDEVLQEVKDPHLPYLLSRIQLSGRGKLHFYDNPETKPIADQICLTAPVKTAAPRIKPKRGVITFNLRRMNTTVYRFDELIVNNMRKFIKLKPKSKLE